MAFGKFESRNGSEINSFVDYNDTVDFAEFRRAEGLFELSGGVVFHGQATFFFRHEDESEEPVLDNLSLKADADGNVFISYKDVSYSFDMHQGLACPLARFTLRGGIIAYTIPSRLDLLRIREQQLVSTVGNAWIAKEFSGGPFENLMERADFADVEPLPDKLMTEIIEHLNFDISAKGREESFWDWDSYFNADFQVTYQVFLREADTAVSVAGVPLRYYWIYAEDGGAFIVNIGIHSQNISEDSQLTNFIDDPFAPVSQYDVVRLFQAASIFRTIQDHSLDEFRLFERLACSLERQDR